MITVQMPRSKPTIRKCDDDGCPGAGRHWVVKIRGGAYVVDTWAEALGFVSNVNAVEATC